VNEEIVKYYEVLGSKSEATDQDVHDSYIEHLKKWNEPPYYPNLTPKKIQEINEAYKKIMEDRNSKKQIPIKNVKSNNDIRVPQEEDHHIKCPSCGYERTERDDGFFSKEECPKCGIYYRKHVDKKTANQIHANQDNITIGDKKKETVSKEVKQSPKLSIDVIFNNPFRILGLPVNATEKEIAKQTEDLMLCTKMGKAPKIKVELQCFPFCDRTSESIEEAKKKIERSENRFQYSFFWYSNEGSVNRLALDVLSEGKAEKAMEIWGKALSKYLADLDNIEESVQLTDGELDDAIIENFLIPYLTDNYEIEKTLSDIFSRRTLRETLKVYAESISESVVDYDEDYFYVISDGPIGTDDIGEEMELDVEIEKTSIDKLIANLLSKNLALPVKEFSYAKNLMVLYLGLAFKENELDIRYFCKALYLAGRIFNSNAPLKQCAVSIVGGHYQHDNGIIIAKYYIDEILKSVKPLLDRKISNQTLREMAKCFALFPVELHKDVARKLTNKPIQHIEKKVAETAEKRAKYPLEANKFGIELYTSTYEDLLILKDILSIDPLRYQPFSDAVADEIVSCSIDYFNKHKEAEHDIDPGDDALKLAKYADSIAIDKRIKGRIHKGMPILEEWVKDKPVRERRKRTESLISYVINQLKALPDPDKALPNELVIADRFLENCSTRLHSLKSILANTVNPIPSTIILEQFDDNENKWIENEDGDFIKKIEDGKYILQNACINKAYWSWGVKHLNFSKYRDFSFECSITKIKGTDSGGFGIVWSFQKRGENDHYFLFCISGNGLIYLREYNQGWVGGFQWTSSESVVCGDETNIMTVRKIGKSLYFYINKNLIVIGEGISTENMTGTGIGFWVESNITIGVNYLYFCNTNISDFSPIFDYNYYINISSTVASKALDFCIAYANRTNDMAKPIVLINNIKQIEMVPELRKRFENNENILNNNLRIKEENTPPLVKLFKKVSKWF